MIKREPIPLQDFLKLRKRVRPGREIVRCGCGDPYCRGWAEVTKGEPWGYRPWEAPLGMIGPLEIEY